MSKKQITKFDTVNIISPFLLIIYLCIGFVPNLEAVDKIAPQWLMMSIVNLFSVSFFYFNRSSLTKIISSVIVSSMSLTYVGFIIWAGLSFFYAINPTEVIVNITRQVNVLLMFLSMGILLFSMKNKLKFISWTITLILIIEVYAVLSQALDMIETTGMISSGSLKGITANRNITAFSLAIKIPFVLYLIYVIKKGWYKIILSGLIFSTLLSLTMIQSRASYLAVGLIFISYAGLNIFLFLKVNNKTSQLLHFGYFLLPFLFSIIVNQTLIADKGADALSRAATISVSTNDGSVNQRLRYYEDVLIHLKSNPIFGTGLGNWKLKSIDYDSQDLVGYIVPYHAHSDFIQLGAELGIVGFILYLAIFFIGVYYVYFLIRFSKVSIEEKVFLFLLIVALGVYTVDANLNFPIARPQVLVVWTLIMALIMIYFQQNKSFSKNLKSNKIINAFFIGISFIAVIPSIYITNQVYKSLKGQMFLLQDFNSNQYNIPLNQVENIVPDIPNITVTTIPINSVKARYYVNARKYDRALSLLDEGTMANPYLFYSEILKSQIFERLGKLDSAKFYAKKAFFGLPNNDLHASRYLNLIAQTSDEKALDKAFEKLTMNKKLNSWKNYLIAASNLKNKNSPKLIERANKAIELFPEDHDIKKLHSKILIGDYALNKSIEQSNKGLEFFNNLDYLNAAKEFEKAMTNNPLDYSHFENAATANYMIGNFDKALRQIDIVINDLNPLNGKCEYIKALIFIRLQDPIGACPLLETSLKSGFTQANDIHNQYCNF